MSRFKDRVIPTGDRDERMAQVAVPKAQLTKTLLHDAGEELRITKDHTEAAERRIAVLNAEITQGDAFVAAWAERRAKLSEAAAAELKRHEYLTTRCAEIRAKVSTLSVDADLARKEEQLERQLKNVRRLMHDVKGRKPGEPMVIPVKARKHEPLSGL